MSNLPVPIEKKNHSQLWKFGAGLLFLAGLSAVVLPLLNGDRPPAIAPQSIEEVSVRPITLRIRASGAVIAIQSVNISPKQAGKLQVLLVEQGDRVRQGQIIARMDDSSILPQVLQARANVESARANLTRLQNGSRPEEILSARARLDSARARLELATTKVKRNQLLANEGVISRDRLDDVRTEERTALADLKDTQRRLELLENGSRAEDIAQAEAQLLQAEANLQSAEVQLEDTIIRAPFDGIIVQRFATAGAFVAPQVSATTTNSATSASIVAIANGLEILARVPEVDISQIRLGQTAEITADAFPAQTFRGRVRLIAPEAIIDQNVTSFQVRVTIETGKNELRSGMNSDLRFLGNKIDNAITVPTVAIVTEGGRTGVLVVDENSKPQFRPVTLGSTVDDRTQILSGVNVGDRIFLSSPR